MSDHLNTLYTSKDWRDVAKFYDHFTDQYEIISWMKKKKTGRAKIYEVKGKTDVVVVIPTADHNGKYARACLDIFDGIQIVFVESGGVNDRYFNYSHNVNKGVKHALEYSPKWIIITNDDMYKIDDIQLLVKELSVLQTKTKVIDTIFFPRTNSYNEMSECKPFIWKLLTINSGWRKLYSTIYKKFGINYVTVPLQRHNIIYRKIIYRKIFSVPHHQGYFMVFSSDFIRSVDCTIFDETFINGHEDTYLFYLLCKRNKYVFSDFRIGSYGGGTLGSGLDRAFREIANQMYFEALLTTND